MRHDEKFFRDFINENISVEKAAILLSMTSRENEEWFKKYFHEIGFTCAVTEVAGLNDDLRKKIINAIVGASLNLNIIEKTPKELHALVHATLEACTMLKLDLPITESFHLKSAIVRNKDWICVAFYGVRAIHTLTNQKTIGIGMMHL